MKKSLLLLCVISLLTSCSSIDRQDKTELLKLKDYSDNQLYKLSSLSYLLNGSTLTTARLIYIGLRRDPLNPQMLINAANFFTEEHNGIAAVIYYYIYTNKSKLDDERKNEFMILFSDAMYQFGLSTHKIKKDQITLADIYKYEDWIFDIKSLEEHTELIVKDFGDIETFIKIIGSTIGIMCNFVTEPEMNSSITSLLPESVVLTETYYFWINSIPAEVQQLEENI